MRRSPVFWLPLALAVLVTGRCAIGSLTKWQKRKIISTVLFEDQLYAQVLSERVKLNTDTDKLPRFVNDNARIIENVDPLASLHTLNTQGPYYSGDNVNLSLTILGKSLTCLSHKRVAFHLALIIGLIQNKDGRKRFKMRSYVFTNIISFYIDMLFAIRGNYENLLRVYDLVHGMLSLAEVFEDNVEGNVEDSIEAEIQNKIRALETELKLLSDIIASSCMINKMNEYCINFKLMKMKNCENMITDNNIITNLDVNIIVETLMENENAIFDFYENIDLLRGMEWRMWTILLKIPKIPSNTETDKFIRTSPIKYSEIIGEIDATRKMSIKKINERAQPLVDEPVDIEISIIEPEVITPKEETPPADT